MGKIRIVLAEDYPVVRIGIRNLLEKKEDMEIVGEATTGEEALQLVKSLCPDILLLDMELPGLDGVEVTRRLKKAGDPVRILALSAYEEKEFVRSMLELGACGYLMKDEASEVIEEAIRKIAAGEQGWFSRRIANKMLDWSAEPPSTPKKLTRREREVLSLVVAGKTNQGIAARPGYERENG